MEVPRKGMCTRRLVEIARECGATVWIPNRSGEIRVRFPDGEWLRFHHSLKDATGHHAAILRRQLREKGCGDGARILR